MKSPQNSLLQGLIVALISVVINTIFLGTSNFNFRESLILFIVITFVYAVAQYFFRRDKEAS